MLFSLYKLESPSQKSVLSQICFILTKYIKFWRRFLKVVNVFPYLAIISPWKRVWPFIWTNLNTLHLVMLCANLIWNGPCCSGEDFWMPFMYFHNIAIISTWKGSILLHLMSTSLKCFVSSLVVTGPVILMVKFKLWKVHDNNNEDNFNNRQILIRKACLSLQLRRAKNGITGKWKQTHGLK